MVTREIYRSGSTYYGTGVSSNTLFKTVFDAVAALSAPGDIIHIAGNTIYVAQAQITFTRTGVLITASSGAVFQHGSSLGDYPLFVLRGSYNILQGVSKDDVLWLDDNWYAGGSNGIASVEGDHNIIQFCGVINCERYGPLYWNATNFKIIYNDLRHAQHCISGATSGTQPISVDGEIAYNKIAGMILEGIKLKHGKRIWVHHNEIDIAAIYPGYQGGTTTYSKQGVSFSHDGPNIDCVAEDNHIYNTLPSITNGYAFLCENNIYGLNQSAPSIAVTAGNIIRNNPIEGPMRYGIMLGNQYCGHSGDNFTVYDNPISGVTDPIINLGQNNLINPPILTIQTPSGSGTTSPATGTYAYASGSSATVTATPASGYSLSHWLLDGADAGSSATIVIPMNANHTIQAVFVQTTPRPTTMKVIGMIGGQDMRDVWNGYGVSTLPNEPALNRLTHVNFAAVSVTSSTNPTLFTWQWDWISTTVQSCHPKGVKVLLSLLGGTDLDNIMATTSLRTTLITNLLNLMASYNLDGLDIDWESYATDHATRLDTFLTELRARIPAGKLLTIDGGFGGTYHRPDISVNTALNVIDWINVMAYDIWAGDEEHSRMDLVVDLMNRWLAAGFPASKLVMGIPTYGKDPLPTHRTYNYRDLVDALNPPSSQNRATGLTTMLGCDGVVGPVTEGTIWWNGQDLCREKAHYVVDNGFGGVYFCDLGRDKLNTSYSLATVIEDILAGVTPTKYTFTMEPFEGQGTVIPAVGSYLFDSGAQAPCEAISATGWIFDHWLIDGTTITTTNPGYLNMVADRSIKAVFSALPIPSHILVVTTTPIIGVPIILNGQNYTTPTPPITLPEGSHSVSCPSNIIVGSDIYNFSQWEDGSTSPQRTFFLTADATILATYVLPPPPPKGNIEVHAFLDQQEIVANGVVVETGETFVTPFTLQENPGNYVVRVTLSEVTKELIAPVTSGQTIRLDFQFTTAPIPPPPSWTPLAIGTGLILLST